MNGDLGLQLQYRPICELKPLARNPRKHPKKQIRQLSRSIREFGFTVPVLVDENGNIVAGNGRVEAAKLAGMWQVPTIRLKNLSPDQLRAYVIADNRLAENAVWDKSILAIDFKHLLKTDFAVTVTGFEMPEIDLILSSPKKNVDPDDAFEIVDVSRTITKPEDRWQLGRHRILCASALEPCSYSKLLGNKRAELVFVGPPYNVINGKSSIQHRESPTKLDATSDSDSVSFPTFILNLLAEYSTLKSVHLVYADSKHVLDLIAAAHPVYDSLLDVCVRMNNCAHSLHRVDELILVFRNGAEQHAKNLQQSPCGCDRSNVWEHTTSQSPESEHDRNLPLILPPKPVALVADALLAYSTRADLVLDPFLGCGETLLAAERTGRCCYSIEIAPHYVDTAIERWQRYTGEDAINTATGKRFAEVRREDLKQ